MITATPAPKVRYAKWLVVPYAFAASLVLLTVAILMGIGGFDFAGIRYETPGEPLLTITIAGLSIFSLPFLLRLPLSRLARFLSATFSLVAPLFTAAVICYLMSQGVLAVHAAVLLGTGLLMAVSVAGFVVLGGPEALRLSR